MATKTYTFETKTCGRCGGTGSHSFNLRDGSVCYGCNGKQIVHTAKGKRQYARFQELLSAPAGTIQAGMVVFVPTVRKFQTVRSVAKLDDVITIVTDWGARPYQANQLVRLGADEATKDIAYAKALEA